MRCLLTIASHGRDIDTASRGEINGAAFEAGDAQLESAQGRGRAAGDTDRLSTWGELKIISAVVEAGGDERAGAGEWAMYA